MGTSPVPAGSAATVEWIAEDLAGGPAQFTVVDGHLITTDWTTDSTTDLPVQWAVSVRGTLIGRGAAGTLDGARSIALAVTRGITDADARGRTNRRIAAE